MPEKTPRKEGDFRDKQDVVEYLKAHPEIEFVRMVYPDILGCMMDQSLPVSEVLDSDNFLENGAGIDGSSVKGLREEGVNESDLLFMPDIRTFLPLPWVYRSETEVFMPEDNKPGFPTWREAIFFGHILNPEGKNFAGDTRYALESFIEKSKADLFTDFRIGPEFEFYLFPGKNDPSPTDHGQYHTGGSFGEVRKEVQLLFSELGWECDHHEVGPGQHELDLKHDSALKMADKIMIAKYALKRVARAYKIDETHRLHASFMPKPMNGKPGSGMHVHQSLWKDGENLFFDEADEFGLSEFARKYIAGLMLYEPGLSLAMNQWINSYKRLVPNHEAPTRVTWGVENRSAYVRVPKNGKKNPKAARAELRVIDPACNPYMAILASLASGLKGYTVNAKVPNPVKENVWKMKPDDDRLVYERDGTSRTFLRDLPANLGEAMERFRESELAVPVFGEHIVNELLRNKVRDWERYNAWVTDYEINNYLPKL